MNYTHEINLSNLTFFKYRLSFAQDYENITFTDFWISGNNSATYICKWERINFIFYILAFEGTKFYLQGYKTTVFLSMYYSSIFGLIYINVKPSFKGQNLFFKKMSDEMSVSKIINPYFKLPNALCRSLLFPGRNPSPCGSTCFGASGFKSMTSSQLYFPGKTLAACLDPLALWCPRPTTPS